MDILLFIENLISVTLRVSPPLIFAGLAGALSYRVGILNMSLEGTLLIGAFTAVITSYYTGSSMLGIIAAGISGGVFGFILSFMVLKYKANNIVVCVGINLFAVGITTFLLFALFGVRGAFSDNNIVGIPKLTIPIIENIPLLRSISGHSLLVYVGFIVVFTFNYIFYQTRIGLRLRATGRNEMAVITAGVNAKGIKYGAIILSGVLAGIGGAHLSLGQLTMFTDNMSDGRGFVALAASVFGGRTPIGTFGGALFFSLADAITIRLGTMGFPAQLIETIPFVVTLITLIFIQRNYKEKSKIKIKRIDIKRRGKTV